MKVKFIERLEEIDDSIYATKSAYDILNLLKNKPKAYRVAYDNNVGHYFIGPAYNYVHQDLIEAAYYSAFYPDMLSSGEVYDYIINNMEDGNLLLFSFAPSADDYLDVEKSSDGYTRKYNYPFGVIYSHEMTPLEDFDFYKVIGKPESTDSLITEEVNFKALNQVLESFLLK